MTYEVEIVNTIRVIGNLAAHPEGEAVVEFSNEDALVICSTLIRLIQELIANELI